MNDFRSLNRKFWGSAPLLRVRWASGARSALLGCWAFAVGLTGCNPLAAFAECDESSQPLTAEENAKVEASVSTAVATHQGLLVWTETGDRSDVTVSTGRNGNSIGRVTDCDANFQGYEVVFEARIESDDGLIRNGPSEFRLQLDRGARLTSLEDRQFMFSLDFARLKAAGETPDRWISGFEPTLTLILTSPEMKPRDTQVLVEEPLGTTNSRTVSIGSLMFP